MNHRQTVQAVTRRLPHLKRHTVAEVLEVTAEVWSEALAQPGSTVTIVNLGRLYIDAQQTKVGGAVREKLKARDGKAPTMVRRLYYRFRPAGWLRELVEEVHEQAEEE